MKKGTGTSRVAPRAGAKGVWLGASPLFQRTERPARWARLASCISLVLPVGGRRDRSAQEAIRCTRWLVPIGLVIGITYAGVYRGAWRCFGEVQGLRLMPAVCVWLLDVTFCGALLMLAASRAADRVWGVHDEAGGPAKSLLGPIGVAALTILCVLKLMLWLSIPEGVSRWPGVWGSAFNEAYPRAFYRPLILAPLWGRWGILLAAGIGRPAANADPLVGALASRQSSRAVLAWFLPIAALTAVYCGYNAKWVLGCVAALGVLGATYLYCVLITRRFGGQTRDTLLSAGLIAELAFLLLYTGLSVRIYAP